MVYSNLLDAISNGKRALLSLLDLTAAFDTVDQNILQWRLETTFGFQDALLHKLGYYAPAPTSKEGLDLFS